MIVRVVRRSLAGLALLGLAAAPLGAVLAAGLGFGELLRAGLVGLLAAVESVGWVLGPQLALAVAVVGLALQQLVARLAGVERPGDPSWIDPAVESALLLGMLGTISGMVSGFAGLTPDQLEPGPLVHSLGQALRSSLVGFLIALVGVWTKARPGAATGPA